MMNQCFPRYNPQYFCGEPGPADDCTEIGLGGRGGGSVLSPAAMIPIAMFAVVGVAALVFFLFSRIRRSRGNQNNQNFQPLDEMEGR